MAAIAPIAYRAVLAHFLPGCVGLYPFGVFIEPVRKAATTLVAGDDGWGGSALFLGTAALVLGLVIEAFRYVSIDVVLNRAFYGRDSSRYQRYIRTEADLKFYEATFETNYAPYQFYTNTAIAIMASIVTWISSKEYPPPGLMPAAIIVSLVLFLAGVRSSWYASRRLRHRFLSEE